MTSLVFPVLLVVVEETIDAGTLFQVVEVVSLGGEGHHASSGSEVFQNCVKGVHKKSKYIKYNPAAGSPTATLLRLHTDH